MAAIIYWMLFPGSTAPETFRWKSGTLVVLGYSSNSVTLAADSLERDPTGKIDFRACKIANLDDRFLFGVAGFSEMEISSGDSWSAVSTARTIAAKIGPNDPERLALEWARHLYQFLSRASQYNPSFYQKMMRDNNGVSSVFAGIRRESEIETVFVNMDGSEIPRKSLRDVVSISRIGPILATSQFRAFGHTDVYIEFANGTSERGARIRTSWLSSLSPQISDAEMQKPSAIQYANWAVEYDDKGTVGGPVDAL
jgi:hypothetical protein